MPHSAEITNLSGRLSEEVALFVEGNQPTQTTHPPYMFEIKQLCSQIKPNSDIKLFNYNDD